MATRSDVLWISHSACALHEMGPGQPECPERLIAVEKGLTESGLASKLRREQAPLATREQLIRVHDGTYVDTILEIVPSDGYVRLDADTAMNPHSVEAALRAAGACVMGVDQVLSGESRAVFCAVRPPGHHAESNRAMGFCLFDSVAVGAAHALAQPGISRVAIVDFDVHHGNGTENIFQADERVLFCSSFQHPLYPGSGADTDLPNILNLPLPAGTEGASYRSAVTEHWLPALDEFRPELVLFSAGFDAHRDDPLAQLELVEDDFAWITRSVKEVADRHAKGRIVSTLEGGYSLSALAGSVAAHVGVLIED